LFTLFEERSKLAAGEPLIVYPRIWPIADLGIPAKEPFGESPPTIRLLDDPLRCVGVRDHYPEDSLRRVHWKATAHRGRLQVRVHEPAATPTLMIVLNVSTFEHHWQGILPDLFERTLSVAGSVATWAVGRGYKVGLAANGCVSRSDQPVRVPPGRSPGQLTAILESLAHVTSFATASMGELLRRESPRAPWGATFVAITAVVTRDLPAALYSLRRAGRPVTLISLASDAPPKLDGITTYHLAPETPAFRPGLDGASDSTAALEAAGLMGRRRWDPIANARARRDALDARGLQPVGGAA
jgi:uncharacterized protein (DUF58 family)